MAAPWRHRDARRRALADAPSSGADGGWGESQVPLQIGHQAPSFTAKAVVNGAFKDISLKEYEGKWVVLLFYPLDLCVAGRCLWPASAGPRRM